MLSSFHEIHVCLERGEVALCFSSFQSKANVYDIRVLTKKNLLSSCMYFGSKIQYGTFWGSKVKAALNLCVP